MQMRAASLPSLCLHQICMKKEIISIAIIAAAITGLPLASVAQQGKPARTDVRTGGRQTPPAVDTTNIPASQRLQNWDDSSTAKKLDSVVVVAYGAQKKSSVTGAIATISEKQIAKRPITNIADALAGSAPGIQTTMSSGQPGGSPSIRVRGFGSISAGSSPLIVVDGI